jgi:hypothetical protein
MVPVGHGRGDHTDLRALRMDYRLMRASSANYL